MIAFADIHDLIRIEPADTLRLTLEGPFAPALNSDPNNLVLRAATALADQAGLQPGASIILSKNLPVASGIGGGSAETIRASFPWLIVLLAVLLLITFVPWISLVIPELLLD